MIALDPASPINLAGEPALALAGMEVRPATREVVVQGKFKVLEPRVMQVLVALARRRGEVVSRHDLTASCWGGLAVGEDAINRCVQAIRKLARQNGGFAITTVPRVGYRLEETINPAAHGATSAPAAKPSIAVMPLANLSEDPAQDYLADAMVTEIASALSRFKSLFVIASSSSLTFKGKAVGARAAARQLGVRYILEGSLRRSGARIRINVQLIDADQDVHIWGQRFDETVDDIFDLQDRVALSAAAQIAPTMMQAETRRASVRPTEDMSSYELYLRADSLLLLSTRADTLRALDLLNRAIALDGGFASALSSAAMCYYNLVLYGWSKDLDGDRRAGVDLALRALKTANDDASVLAVVGAVVVVLGGDHDAGAALVQRATELNPGNARAWLISGMVNMRAGDSGQAIEHIDTSMRLDPVGPSRPYQIQIIGMSRFQQGRFGEAVHLLKEVVQHMESPVAYAVLAASCAFLGRREEARDAFARWKSTSPYTSEDFARSVFPLPSHIALLVEGLELAGGSNPSEPAAFDK